MTSQILAIFYLNDFDHFVKEKLHIKYYVRYQDDFLLFHPSKQYLKHCLDKIKIFLAKENLVLNKKTRLYSNKNYFIFLGRDTKGNYTKYRDIRRKLRKKFYLYKKNYITLSNLTSSIATYQYLCPQRLKKLE